MYRRTQAINRPTRQRRQRPSQPQRRRCRRQPKRSRADMTATASGPATTTATANHRGRRARQQRRQGVGRRRANRRSVNHGLIDGSWKERRRRRQHPRRRRHRPYTTRPRRRDSRSSYRRVDGRCSNGTETRHSETRTNNQPTARNIRTLRWVNLAYRSYRNFYSNIWLALLYNICNPWFIKTSKSVSIYYKH